MPPRGWERNGRDSTWPRPCHVLEGYICVLIQDLNYFAACKELSVFQCSLNVFCLLLVSFVKKTSTHSAVNNILLYCDCLEGQVHVTDYSNASSTGMFDPFVVSTNY